MADYLFELGCEEIPARFAPKFLDQLLKCVSSELAKAGFISDTTHITSAGTYRRLTLMCQDLLDQQEDHVELITGPPLSAAKKENNWTPAALGFARKCGVEPADLITQRDAKGREVLACEKQYKGQSIAEFLVSAMPRCLRQIELPIAMYWGEGEGPFFRPVQWLLSVLNTDVLAFEFCGVKASNLSYGHRFLTQAKHSLGDSIVITDMQSYEDVLLAHKVMISSVKRRSLVEGFIELLSDEKPSEALIDEVVWLTEFPQAIEAAFDAEYLHLPQEVLAQTMIKHQKFFPIYKAGLLQNEYVLFSDNLNRENKASIKKGNQAVLKARLADVAFFWQQDTQKPLDAFLPGLKKVVFLKGLGSVSDRIERFKKMAPALMRVCNAEGHKRDILRAIELCKADLQTQMVFELPDLQGVMGAYYAEKQGEKPKVVEAIRNQYQDLPRGIEAKCVALLDRLDLIVAAYKAGKKPSSSKDPLGIRRAMIGILKIILSLKLPIKLVDCVDLAANELELGTQERDLLDTFFQQRVAVYLSDELGIAKDLIQAHEKHCLGNVFALVEKLIALGHHRDLDPDSFKKVAEAAVRTHRLLAKNSIELLTLDACEVSEPVEQALKRHLQTMKESWTDLCSLAHRMSAYYDAILVNVEDTVLKQHRLSLIAIALEKFDHWGTFEGLEKSA